MTRPMAQRIAPGRKNWRRLTFLDIRPPKSRGNLDPPDVSMEKELIARCRSAPS